MARYNKIDLGPANENLPQTHDALAATENAPGSVIVLNASGEFDLATATNARQGDQVYIADHNWCAGRQVSDNNPAGEAMTGQLPLPKKKYAALVADGVNINAKNFALTVGANGELVAATLGTDYVQFRSDEIYNNDTGSAQLVAVRPVTV